MKTRLIVLFILLFMAPKIALGIDPEHDDLVHFAAHFGMSYAINTFMYGICRKGLHFDKTDALIFAAVTTLFVGAMYKATEATSANAPINGADFRTSMIRNAIGTGASAGTMLMFDF